MILIKTDRENVARNIKAFLEYARWQGYGFSQPDIAKETGISQCQLSNYETGKTIPSLLAAIAIADMFDISLDYLVGRCQNSKAHKTRKEFKYKEES
jgi:transcriptional regulator with XRE-family HTH domain